MNLYESYNTSSFWRIFDSIVARYERRETKQNREKCSIIVGKKFVFTA